MASDPSVFGAGQRGATGSTVHWQELWRHELEAMLPKAPVVIVPCGSVEQHGPHCPMDVDISHTQALAVATARAIADFPVVVAPAFAMASAMAIERAFRLRPTRPLAAIIAVCETPRPNPFRRETGSDRGLHRRRVGPLRAVERDVEDREHQQRQYGRDEQPAHDRERHRAPEHGRRGENCEVGRARAASSAQRLNVKPSRSRS